MKADQTSLNAQNPDNRLIAIDHTVYVTVRHNSSVLFCMQHATSHSTLCQSGKQQNRKYDMSTFKTELVQGKLFHISQQFFFNVLIFMIQVALMHFAQISNIYIYSLLGLI
jgi:hypothetical protein